MYVQKSHIIIDDAKFTLIFDIKLTYHNKVIEDHIANNSKLVLKKSKGTRKT